MATFLTVMLILAGATTLERARSLSRRIRTLEAVPQLTVDEALTNGATTPGPLAATVQGRATAPEGGLLRSPVSGHVCVWWALEVTAVSRSPAHAALLTRRKAASASGFHLAGATGRIRVRPTGLDAHTGLQGTSISESLLGTPRSRPYPPITRKISELLPHIAEWHLEPGTYDSARFTEWILTEGTEAKVTGDLYAAHRTVGNAAIMTVRRPADGQPIPYSILPVNAATDLHTRLLRRKTAALTLCGCLLLLLAGPAGLLPATAT